MKEQTEGLPVSANQVPPPQTTEYLFVYPSSTLCQGRPGVGEVLTRATFSPQDLFGAVGDEEFIVLKVTRMGGRIAEVEFHAAHVGVFGNA